MSSSPEAIRVIGTGLISMGLGLLLFAGVTAMWGDPFTYLLEREQQGQLERQLHQQSLAFGDSTTTRAVAPDPRLTRASAQRFSTSLRKGQAAGRLRIPRIGLNKVVVKGTGTQELTTGPGLYPEAMFPGTGAPVGIAGHRTTYGAPFLNIDEIRVGDPVYVDMPYGRFEYRVTRTRIVQPDDWSILRPGAALSPADLRRLQRRAGWARGLVACDPRGRGGATNCEHLVLTACHPKYSAAQRYVVLAQLRNVVIRSSAQPAGRAA